MSNQVIIKDAVKRYGDFTALNGVSLDIREGEFFTLLGPSGCGKTTLLRMIAGFNSIEGGDFYFGDKRINDVPAHKRDIGMVFQNYAIFPHMTVRDNVAFGLKNRKESKETIQKETDEFMKPVVCCKDAGISHRDSVIFYNFRPDRAREITRTLTDPEFDGFVREGGLVAPYYVCFTQYDAAMPGVQVAFKPQVLENILGQVVSEAGMTQLRIAETEKYAHVTFFFNGGEERVFPGEDRVLIESPKVATFDMKPEMSAYEVTDAVCSRIESGKYDLIVLNFANCDMVGHTGVLPAAIQAVEAVDTCLGRVLASLEKMGGAALVTADHGNAEQMVGPDGTPFTAHTTNEVPLILVGKKAGLKEGGRLCDIAPTLLSMLGLEKPEEMTGQSLLTAE